MNHSGKVPVMSCNLRTGSVLKQTDGQTVISVATQLSCNPVRQVCISVLQRSTTQWFIKVDGLEIKIQRCVIVVGNADGYLSLYAIQRYDT